MAEHKLPKLDTGVRFPSLAPYLFSLLALFSLCVSVSGCGTSRAAKVSRPAASVEIQSIRVSKPGASLHTVRPGETVWRISKMYGVDIDDLVRANSLTDKTAVEAGQVLVIPKGASVSIPVRSSSSSAAGTSQAYIAPANTQPKACIPRIPFTASRDSFAWPLRGQVIATYGSKVDKTSNKGIDIQSYEGAEIKASRAGVVVFCDDQMKGFGKTVILDHGDNYQTVYAYNSDILVKVGDTAQQGTVIAKVGKTGRARTPSLHFEIRRNGEPKDPFYYLPR